MNIIEYIAGPYDTKDGNISVCLAIDEEGDPTFVEISHETFEDAYLFKVRIQETLEAMEEAIELEESGGNLN